MGVWEGQPPIPSCALDKLRGGRYVENSQETSDVFYEHFLD